MPDKKRNLPDWIDAFMLLTENSEPPILFRKWTAISAIASALQRKVRVDLGISLTFYPNFYIVLVGPPSTGKGTVMRYASDIITEVASIKLSAQATSLQALIRRMKETNFTDIDMITGRQQYHSSLTIFSNEFTVFLGYHNRELIAALCDWYDCPERWIYDTIKRDREEIVGVWANLLAGTTQENIQTSLPIEAIGGGLTSRIIFVNEERKAKLVIFPEATEREMQLQQMLTHDLEQVSTMSGSFAFTEKFVDLYSAWCKDADRNPPFYDKKFEGYCGRRRKHLIGLSMVCSASQSNELVLDAGHLERAIRLLAEVEVKMGLVFRGMGQSDISSLMNNAILFVERSPDKEIPLWKFARYFEGDMDKDIMDRVLYTLEASKYVKVIKKPGADTVILRIDRSKNKQSTDPSP